jgi:hypothetical protein
MTKFVCEKFGQNAAQPVYCQKLTHKTLTLEKVAPKMWATSLIYKTCQSKHSPKGRKFAQSVTLL